jgi:hypothetical protein
MQTGPAPKRTKTLTQEVAKLKKQVSKNKHELKYFDNTVEYSSSTTTAENSFFVLDQPSGSPDSLRAPFIGRKIYVHKIEYRFTLPTNAVAMIYRCKKTPKNASSIELYPKIIDPEYHTILRYSENLKDTTKQVETGIIDFKGTPRLVELDNPGEDTLVSPFVTTGDIRWFSNGVGRTVTYRLWYHDG